MIQRKQDQLERKKNPINSPLKKNKKSLKQARVRRSDEEIKILKYRLKSVKLHKVTYLPHIQEQYTVHSTQETIWVRGHGRIKKLKWAKIQKTSKKIRMKIPTS